MPRFYLSQLFMGVALVAIVLGLTQADGWSERYLLIEGLSFSSDDSKIAVTKVSAYDANTPGKGHKRNPSRTISWLQTSTGQFQGIVHEDLHEGNCGPAFQFMRIGRTSAVVNPANDRVLCTGFGGGSVEYCKDRSSVEGIVYPEYVNQLAVSKSGRFVAASGQSEALMIDLQNYAVVKRTPMDGEPFLGTSRMTFSQDEKHLILANGEAVSVWDIDESPSDPRTIFFSGPMRINSVAAAHDDTMIVGAGTTVQRYDSRGNVVATLIESDEVRQFICRTSRDGKRLAVTDDDVVKIYDLTDNSLLKTLPIEQTSMLALSSDGTKLAVGEWRGRVALWDTATGTRQWDVNPPPRERWPWMFPAGALVVWVVVAWRMWKRKRDSSGPPLP